MLGTDSHSNLRRSGHPKLCCRGSERVCRRLVLLQAPLWSVSDVDCAWNQRYTLWHRVHGARASTPGENPSLRRNAPAGAASRTLNSGIKFTNGFAMTFAPNVRSGGFRQETLSVVAFTKGGSLAWSQHRAMTEVDHRWLPPRGADRAAAVSIRRTKSRPLTQPPATPRWAMPVIFPCVSKLNRRLVYQPRCEL
jgi:hypothetical protein